MCGLCWSVACHLVEEWLPRWEEVFGISVCVPSAISGPLFVCHSLRGDNWQLSLFFSIRSLGRTTCRIGFVERHFELCPVSSFNLKANKYFSCSQYSAFLKQKIQYCKQIRRNAKYVWKKCETLPLTPNLHQQEGTACTFFLHVPPAHQMSEWLRSGASCSDLWLCAPHRVLLLTAVTHSFSVGSRDCKGLAGVSWVKQTLLQPHVSRMVSARDLHHPHNRNSCHHNN